MSTRAVEKSDGMGGEAPERQSRLGFGQRLGLYLSMVRYANAHNRDFAREHWEFFKQLQSYVPDLEHRRVLEVGCGKAMWLTILLQSLGAKATGVDTEVVTPGRSLSKYISIARGNGLERALRTLMWDLVYAGPYYRELASVSSFVLRFEAVDARAMDATALDFPDDTFDLIVSHEVFEHIADIRGTIRELHRVMRKDAITYIYIHNYTSLSGGHHIAWKYPDSEPSDVVPPWDHLRENQYPEIPSWVNGLRENEYRHAFEEWFDILDWFPTVTEGKSLLTPDIRTELSDYTEDELLTKGFVVVARPKPPLDAPVNGITD